MLRLLLLPAALALAGPEARVPDPADGARLRRVQEEVSELVDRLQPKVAALQALAPRYDAEGEFPAVEIERRLLLGEVEARLAELNAKQDEFQERSRRYQILRGALMVANLGAGDKGAAEGDVHTFLEYEEAPREVSRFINSARDALSADAAAFELAAARRAERARARSRARLRYGAILLIAPAALVLLRLLLRRGARKSPYNPGPWIQ